MDGTHAAAVVEAIQEPHYVIETIQTGVTDDRTPALEALPSTAADEVILRDPMICY